MFYILGLHKLLFEKSVPFTHFFKILDYGQCLTKSRLIYSRIARSNTFDVSGNQALERGDLRQLGQYRGLNRLTSLFTIVSINDHGMKLSDTC